MSEKKREGGGGMGEGRDREEGGERGRREGEIGRKKGEGE